MRSRFPQPLLWVAAAAIILAAATPMVLRYLVFWPLDQWQVDVEVYREAGVSVLTGRPIYSALTESPQLLPFTYPPFAALLAIPLALVPFGAVGWIWTGLQILATTAIVWYAGWRLIHGFGAWAPIALAVLTAPMLWLAPVADGLRFGQVNAFMVLACLMDLRNPRPLWLRRVPRGVLIGLAMAVKLTPGVFVIHLLVTRRWREASTAIGTAVLVTLGAFVVLPEASLTFWGGALQDPSRLGPNVGSSNQSLRGVLLRLLPDSTLGSVLWVILAAAVAIGGFWLARQRYLAHDSIGEVAVVGLLACLLSPVAWIHHHHWVVVVIFAILGAQPAQHRARAGWAAIVAAFYTVAIPWWGNAWLTHPDWPAWFGELMQNFMVVQDLAVLVILWWVSRTPGELHDPDDSERQADQTADPPQGGQPKSLQESAA